MTTDLSVPEPSLTDRVHAILKGGIGSIPVAGNLLAEIFGMVMGPPIERRRREWYERVAETVIDLSKKGVDLDTLRDNPEFIDTVIQTSRIAMTTSQSEKLEALRNAVINAALSGSPDSTRRQLILHWVDGFTAAHVQILELFDDPPRWFASRRKAKPEFVNISTFPAVLRQAYPELAADKELCQIIWTDLHSSGLIGATNYSINMSAHGAMQSQTTETGRQFAQFLRAPNI
jgi:hypothetical protein